MRKLFRNVEGATDSFLTIARSAGERTAPVRLEFEKRILDGSEVGVLFPAFGDFNGDGKIDLLVGVRGLGQGRLREERSGEARRAGELFRSEALP